MLPDLIEMAHEEMARLLGSDAWRVYGHDEWGSFYSAAEIHELAVA